MGSNPYNFGQQAGQFARGLPGRVGRFARNLPAIAEEAALFPFEPARMLGGGIRSAAGAIDDAGDDFAAGLFGPSAEEMRRQTAGFFQGQDTPEGVMEVPSPLRPSIADEDFSDVLSGASSPAQVRPQAPPPAPTQPESHIRFSLGDGPMEDYRPGETKIPAIATDDDDMATAFGQRYKPAAGGGTVSMLSGSPEAEAYATRGSRMEDLEFAAQERAAKGEPSLADMTRFRQQQALQYKPEDQREDERLATIAQEFQRVSDKSKELAAQVQAGQMTPEQADALHLKFKQDSMGRIQALNKGSLQSWGPPSPNGFQFPTG